MSHVFTEEEANQIKALQTSYDNAKASGDTVRIEKAREELQDYLSGALSRLHSKPVIITCPEYEHWDEVLKKCMPPVKPASNLYVIKAGGWGASQDAKTWKVTNMRNPPSEFKVVDDNNVNVATNFKQKETAEDYIVYYRWEQSQTHTCPPGQHWDSALGKCVIDTPIPTCPAGQHWDATLQKCVPDTPSTDTPYAPIGQPMQSTQRGPTVRHYASGKEDDWTIEKNTKAIKFKNYQCVVDVTNDCVWAHDDTFSIKLGGTHMGSGWFDNTLGIYTGRTGLGTEEEHPSADLFIIEGPRVGDTRGKRFKLACTYFTDANKVELWTNFGDGWKKQVEGSNIGGFNPKSSEDEFQLRIDGFKAENDPPTIHSAFVTEIAVPSFTAKLAGPQVKGKGQRVECSDDLDD